MLPRPGHQTRRMVGAPNSGVTSVPVMSPLPHAASMALIGVLTLGGVGYLRTQRTPRQCWW